MIMIRDHNIQLQPITNLREEMQIQYSHAKHRFAQIRVTDNNMYTLDSGKILKTFLFEEIRVVSESKWRHHTTNEISRF